MCTMYFDHIPAHCPFQLLQDFPPGLPSNFMLSFLLLSLYIIHTVKGKQKENNPEGKSIAIPRTRNQEGE